MVVWYCATWLDKCMAAREVEHKNKGAAYG